MHCLQLLRSPAAVPCLSRASEVEKYDPKSEFVLSGDDDGWVATHQDPKGDTTAAAEEDIPDLDDPDPSASHQGVRADDDEVPDISELELVETDDEVSVRHHTVERRTAISQ